MLSRLWYFAVAAVAAFAIAAVLVVGLGILLIVVGTLHFVRAGVASMGGIDEAIQNRLAARSAVRALAGDLHADRDSMLRGSIPQLPASYELFDLLHIGGGRHVLHLSHTKKVHI